MRSISNDGTTLRTSLLRVPGTPDPVKPSNDFCNYGASGLGMSNDLKQSIHDGCRLGYIVHSPTNLLIQTAGLFIHFGSSIV